MSGVTQRIYQSVNLGTQATSAPTDIFHIGTTPRCSCTVLMSPHDTAIDGLVFVVCILTEHFEDALPHSLLRPAAEAGVDHTEVAVAFG